ncbi:MAG: pilin [Candidatus Altiarchaeota archaeon]|nr:pilin [Candidatus Altiarchaeota archaeon]
MDVKGFGFLIGLFLFLTLSVFAADPTVSRDLPVSAAEGSAFTVTLTMDVDEADLPSSVNVTEYYPVGWTVSHISTGGTDMGNRIEWNCSDLDVCKIVDQDLTYTVAVPFGASSGVFQGIVDIGAGPYPVIGDTDVSITPPVATTTTTVTTTTTLKPTEVIMKRINKVVCDLLTIIWYIAGGITALIIIFAGMKYMASDDPQEINKAKSMVAYAVVGLILVIIACPLVNYLVVNTNVTPFEDSCRCLIGNPPRPTTTTVPGATTTTVPGVTTTVPGVTTTTVPGVTTTVPGVTTTTVPGVTTTTTPAVPVCLDDTYACTRNNACSTACAGTPTCRDDINNNDIADIDEFCGVSGFKECCCNQGLGPCCCGPLI